MADSLPPAPIPDEELIAYLDGELDDAACRRIEQLLITDPTIRRRLQELEQTWQLLDQLEPPAPNDRLTRSTLEMVAVEAEQELTHGQLFRGRAAWIAWGGALVALFAAAALGFALGWSLAPDPDRQLLEDLPLLENLDGYRQIDDFQFLKALHQRGLFQEDWADEQ